MSGEITGLGRQVPPVFGHMLIYFDQAGFSESEAKRFYNHYEEMDWRASKAAWSATGKPKPRNGFGRSSYGTSTCG